MVGDLHFIIRHGLTGLVFLFFVLFGIWNWEIWFRNGCDIASYILPQPTPAAASQCTVNRVLHSLKDIQVIVIGFAPIIGITLQGSQILRRFRSKKLFSDHARTSIARRIVDMLSNNDLRKIHSQNSDLACIDKFSDALRAIKKKNPDALYVWAYHTDANDRLIEWARRRRSYHYLGLHFGVSVLVGSIIGAVIAFIINYPTFPSVNKIQEGYTFLQIIIQLFLLISVCLWGLAAYYLSIPMKNNADNMELAWSFGFLYPDFKKNLFNKDSEDEKK